MQNCFGNLETIRETFVCFLLLLLLLVLKLLHMIPLQLFEIVIAAKNNLFPAETNPHWVGSEHDLFDSLRSNTFHSVDQKVRELKVREDLHDSRVVHAWHQDPLGKLAKAFIFSNQLSNLLEVHLELLEAFRFSVLL